MLAEPIQYKYRARSTAVQDDEAGEFCKRIRGFNAGDDPRAVEELVLGLLVLRANAAQWPRVFDAALGNSKESLSAVLAGEAAASFNTAHLVSCAEKIEARRLSELAVLVDELGRDSGVSLNELLPRIFDGCLRSFATGGARSPGEQATSDCVAELMVELAGPTGGVLFDPCCGAGGLLARAWQYAEQNGEGPALELHGRESGAFHWRAATMNAALRGIPIDLGESPRDIFHDTTDDGIDADIVLADPPFNQKNWNAAPNRTRWPFGAPPNSNANFAWLQHIIARLSPRGIAVVAMSSSSLSSQIGGESEIRRRIVDADLLDCIVSLPGGIFPSGRASACLWILNNDKSGELTSTRDRRGRTLMIDAQSFNAHTRREAGRLDTFEQARIVSAYRAWRSAERPGADIPGFCRAVTRVELSRKNDQLLPGLYVTAFEKPPEERRSGSVRSLMEKLQIQFDESQRLETLIRERMQELVDA